MNIFEAEVNSSSLEPEAAMFLKEQVETALLQFGRQLSSPPVHRVNADRLFEGDGYRVSIKVATPSSDTPFSLIKKVFGFQ